MKKDAYSQRWIFKRIRPYLSKLIVLIAFAAIISYINVQFALASKELIDVATGEIPGVSILACAVKLGVLLVLQLCLQVVYIRIHIKTSGKLSMSIRTDLFYQLMKKDFVGVSEFHSGEILNRLVSDVSLISEKITEIVPNVVALFSTVVFSFVALYRLDKYFAIACLALGPVVMLASYIYKKRIKNLHLKCRESDGKSRSFMQETIQNFLVVKAFGKETVMRHRSEELQYENFRLNVRRSTVGILANVMFFLAVTVGYYAALAWSVYRLSLGLITFGTVTAVLGLVSQLQSPFREIASLFPQYYMILASAERLIELENLKDDDCETALNEDEIKQFDGIYLENLNFSYDGVSVLKDVNLTVKKGEFIAVCGASGAGKSTLSKLLLSVLNAKEGRAYISLSDKREINLCSSTRKLFSYVPQGNLILSGTVRDNITFADENPDEEKVFRAVKLSQLEDVIDAMPKGLDTILGEKGHGLSEGQVQRIAIARALYFDAPILLLDEATSALDIATEDRLLRNLKEMTDKTCVIISHRKEVMQACDKTYVLLNGTLDVLS